VPKYPLSLAEASALVRQAGGILVLAHPDDPNGTSLVSLSSDLDEQTGVVEGYMLDYLDGIECWHSRSNAATTAHYVAFARKHRLVMTGGSDCHQKPILMGSVAVPDFVAEQLKNYIFSP
jgi:predicted metal-dependent phosphoesterase TrpH